MKNNPINDSEQLFNLPFQANTDNIERVSFEDLLAIKSTNIYQQEQV